MGRGILDRIIDHKRQEVAGLYRALKPGARRRLAEEAPPVRDFLAALRHCPHVPIIAEIKKASPSAGRLGEGIDVGRWAKTYQAGGAAALSVLTDATFFGGSLDDLRAARTAVSLPVLRKDFIIDPVQLHESRLAGADAVLLIVAALAPAQLESLYAEARGLGLTVLVEVHHQAELDQALALGPSLIGINNRNLATLEVSLNTCLRLRPLIPDVTLVVGESGIQGPSDVARLLSGGLDAFLVGTTLMRADDPEAMLHSLTRAGG